MVNERVEQIKRQQFISLDSQFMNHLVKKPWMHLNAIPAYTSLESVFHRFETQVKVVCFDNKKQ